MATTKLTLWNGCLLELGHRRLSDTGEAIEPARELTAIHDQVVEECLAAGSWNFAMETVQLDNDTGVTPGFGFTKVFAKPSDWIRTHGVSADEYLAHPLLHYYDDDTILSADVSPIYVRYVSNDTGLGLDVTRWPANFARYVQLELADRICMKITQSATLKDQIGKSRDKARRTALNHDVMNEPQPRFMPPSSWTLARGGTSRGDRGGRGSLTG